MAADPRHVQRLALGKAAVLSPSAAAALMPVADTRAMRWLHANGLIQDLDGTPVVVWEDVMNTIRRPGTPEDAPAHLPAMMRVKLKPL